MADSAPEHHPRARVPRRHLVVFRAMALLLALAVAWLLGEAALALFGVEPTYVAPELHPGRAPARITIDREVLFRFVPRSRPDLNNRGYRDSDFAPKPAGVRRILFMGDSFVMGVSTTTHETIPRQLENLLGPPWDVLNMGVYADGPDQSLLRLRRDGLDLGPDVVLLALFPANDFGDLLKNMIFRPVDGDGLERRPDNIVTRALPRSRLAMQLRRLTTTHSMDPQREEALFQGLMGDAYLALEQEQPDLRQYLVALMRGIFTAFQRLADEHGFGFSVIVIPPVQAFGEDPRPIKDPVPAEQALRNDQVAFDLCSELGIEALYLREAIGAAGGASLYDPLDIHLNAEGSRIAAQAIYERFFGEAEAPSSDFPANSR